MKIKIILKNGKVWESPDENRGGGSYSNQISYEGAWVIVSDVWGNTVAYPSQDVQEVQTRQRG